MISDRFKSHLKEWLGGFVSINLINIHQAQKNIRIKRTFLRIRSMILIYLSVMLIKIKLGLAKLRLNNAANFTHVCFTL